MGEKLRNSIKKNKSKFIVVIILWLILSVIFVGPLSFSIMQKNAGGNFIKAFLDNIAKPFDSLGLAFQTDIGLFLKILLEFSIVYLIAMGVAIIRAFPKSEYDNIEYGSSDWCQGGEQYRVLSQKSRNIACRKKFFTTR